MKFRFAAALALWLGASISGALAQTPTFYSLKDTAGTNFQVGVFQNAGNSKIFPGSVSVDAMGSPLSAPAGTAIPGSTALLVQGVNGGFPLPISASSLPLPTGASTQATSAAILAALGPLMQNSGGMVGISGPLPSFLTPPTFNCGTGCNNDVSITSFHAEFSLPVITATVGGITSSVFTAGKSVLVQNIGATNPAYCAPGLAASTASQYIAAGSSAVIGTTTETAVTCATASSTTTINFQVGTGLWTGAGGGIGGGGGGGGASSPFSSAFPGTGTAIGVSDGTNMVPLNLGQQLAAASLPVVLTASQLSALTPLSSVAVTGTFWQATQPISAASLPLPTGAATQTTLASLLAALGSPFQAGASIGNTSFGATQATASNLNATVVGTGTFAVQAAQTGTWNVTNVSGIISLPTGASTSALQTTGNTSLASILTALGSPFQAAGTLGAGSAIIGNVRIDQTTPATTNGVAQVPNSASAGAITPAVSATSESSHLFKSSAGNIYSSSATNQTATAGFYLLLDAATAPADGAVTPIACAPLPPSGSASIGYGDIPARFSTGMVGVVSSGSNCFTKTTGAIVAFMSGQVK